MEKSPMRFHQTCGCAVTLSEDRTEAVRSDASFCGGLVFSAEPLKPGQKVCVELTCSQTWSGALRLGVTSSDPTHLSPADLPRLSLPDLARKDGYWVRGLREKLLRSGSQVLLYITCTGLLQVFVDGQHRGAYLSHLPTNRPLWLLLDLYASTTGARFTLPDEVPRELQARGPEAVRAYEVACETGTQPVYRTRLMLVGRHGVGKTSLKHALTGLSHNKNEESTDGIDLSASASFRLHDNGPWRLAIKGQTTPRDNPMEELSFIDGAEGVEEEYYQALAHNVAQELLFQRKQAAIRSQSGVGGQSGPASRASTAQRTLSTPHRSPSTRSNKSNSSMVSRDGPGEIPAYLREEMPERVVKLVQDILDSQPDPMVAPPTPQDGRPERSGREKRVVLNIWDFAGKAAYYTTHQVFLTSRAVYVIVFNLCDDLAGKKDDGQEKDDGEADMTTLEYMDFWMRSVHAHAAENAGKNAHTSILYPSIFIVGTHRASLHPDPDQQAVLVEEKFAQIREFVMSKPYTQHISTPFFAVENNLEGQQDEQVEILRSAVERVAEGAPYMGERVPIRWLRLEQEVLERVEAGTHFASIEQVAEMARTMGIESREELCTMLDFFHDLGVLVSHHRAPDTALACAVILNPQWLMDMARRILTARPPDSQWDLLKDRWRHLEQAGVLEEALLDVVWQDCLPLKGALLRLMESLDLLCLGCPAPGEGHHGSGDTYYVPMRLPVCEDKRTVYIPRKNHAFFYLDFNGFLPDGLFFRLLARSIRWSQELGGRTLMLFRRIARFYLDDEHDFVLEMAPRALHRIKVTVLLAAEPKDKRKGPAAFALAKVRNFLEASLAELRTVWMKRMSYRSCLPCPCDKACYLHDRPACSEPLCLHFLDLDECLASKVVCCEFRRVKTQELRKWFPEVKTSDFREPVLPSFRLELCGGNLEKHAPSLPLWIKGAAKLLSAGEENQDWRALAKVMGYKSTRVEKLAEDYNPALALLADWVLSSGNTTYSVDMLVIFLEQLHRHDVIDIIERAREAPETGRQVFLSYQWDSQDEVTALRSHLEQAGFSCWMDIGQMGGGDQLLARIDDGIRNCQVVVACLTPKFVVSQLCSRELALADMLGKPIIPVVMETVVWPPPGAMAVILAQLVYINMKGVGGHGGTGIHADLQDKHNEVVQRVSLYATPTPKPCLDPSLLSPPTPSPGRGPQDSFTDSQSLGPLEQFPPAAAAHPADRQSLAASERPVSHLSVYRPAETVAVRRCTVCTIL